MTATKLQASVYDILPPSNGGWGGGGGGGGRGGRIDLPKLFTPSYSSVLKRSRFVIRRHLSQIISGRVSLMTAHDVYASTNANPNRSNRDGTFLLFFFLFYNFYPERTRSMFTCVLGRCVVSTVIYVWQISVVTKGADGGDFGRPMQR